MMFGDFSPIKKTLDSVSEEDNSVHNCTASLTHDGSLLSSFSADTQDDSFVISLTPIRRRESLRRRRNSFSDDDDEDEFAAASEGTPCKLEEGLLLQQTSMDTSTDSDDSSTADVDRQRVLVPRIPVSPRMRSKNRVSNLRQFFLYSLILFFCIYEIGVYRRFRPWRLPARDKVQAALTYIRKQPVSNGLTIRLRGQSIDLIHQSLQQHSHCPMVRRIDIDWTADTEDAPSADMFAQYPTKVRTKPSKPATDAILLLDEGIYLSCEQLEKGFNEWRQNPTALVGFLPMHLSQDPSIPSFSLVSDGALVMHRFYQHALRYAHLHAECQHVAVSAWVTALTGQGPTAMAGGPLMVNTEAEHKLYATRECQTQALEATGLNALPVTRMTMLGSAVE